MIRVRRRTEPPASLAERALPFKEDVQAALDEDFSGKCYLCEGSARGNFDVEHLRPVIDFPDREFDWHNLFPACSRCNGRRKRWSADEHEPGCKRWPKGGMLDCAQDDIEVRLQQVLSTDVGGVAARFFPTGCEDSAAANTAKELNAIHSVENEWGKQICALIERRYRAVLESCVSLMRALGDCGHNWDAPAVRIQQTKLELVLSTSAPYAGLIRTKMRHDLPAQWVTRLAL
ncbi:MAG: hypothetical protein JW940_03140 [Polyangiaceae bacterium]|nr:hypothetical protein [Polyangiaceae bacterium]